jgi:trimeric autotransporter adhesin
MTLNANRQLESIGTCPTGLCLARGTAQHADSGANSDASWGRWVGGTLHLDLVGFYVGLRQDGNQSVHYLVGTPATALPTSGTFSYQQTASTAATLGGNIGPNGTFTGTLGVSFGPGAAAKVGLSGNVMSNGNSYNFSTNGGALNPSTSEISLGQGSRFTGSLSTTSSGTSNLLQCQGTCTTQVNGGLFGIAGQTGGYAYRIQGNNSTTINGIGVFTKQ